MHAEYGEFSSVLAVDIHQIQHWVHIQSSALYEDPMFNEQTLQHQKCREEYPGSGFSCGDQCVNSLEL